MAYRKHPLVNNQIYHIFNRSVDKIPIFANAWINDHALKTINFYRFSELPIRFSLFDQWSKERQSELIQKLENKLKDQVDILCFCLMPNHFHFLIKQKIDSGISNFISLFQNSFTRYFNSKKVRVGHLFQGEFKSVLIESDEQLLHVSRYIHLNPYTSYIVRGHNKILNYRWSSLADYLSENKKSFCKTKIILSLFKNKQSYKKFVLDQAEYQRSLKNIQHLILEKK